MTQDLESECIVTINEQLEKENAKIRANLFKTTLRKDGETYSQYLSRIWVLFQASKKVTNGFGQIVSQEEYKKQHGNFQYYL